MPTEDTRWLSADEQCAWRGYLRMQGELASQLNRRLLAATSLSAADYEVLVRLSESPGETLRVFELGSAVDWEKSRLSHHLRRMVARGLVDRRECPTDGRGAFVVLTSAGRKAIAAAAPQHVDDVRRYVVDALGPERLAALREISETVLAALQREP